MLRKSSKDNSNQFSSFVIDSNDSDVVQELRFYSIDELPADWPDDRQFCKPRTIYGYRVNTGMKKAFDSLFVSSHNEFCNIWSDIGPLIIIIGMLIAHVCGKHFQNSSLFQKLLEIGVFIGAIISRSASSFYHTFNCVSKWHRERLIQIDLIGICAMSFCSPYFYFLGNDLIHGDVFERMGYQIYLLVLFVLFIVPVIMFLFNLKYGETHTTSKLRQVVLVVLASWGNIVAVRLFVNTVVPFWIRFICLLSVFCFLFGYVCCFLNLFPEVLFEKEGISDGKWWNSHVIWHFCAGIAQIAYCLVPLCFAFTFNNS